MGRSANVTYCERGTNWEWDQVRIIHHEHSPTTHGEHLMPSWSTNDIFVHVFKISKQEKEKEQEARNLEDMNEYIIHSVIVLQYTL